MIVVSNTSPLTNLAAVDQFDLLRRLYAQVQIADGVWDELNAKSKHWPGRAEVAAADWIRRHAIQDQTLVTSLMRDLDRGESESITLALELRADLILLDEKEGRHIAQRFGLRTVGVIGIVVEAKAKGMIGTIRPLLDALRQRAGFYISDALYQSTLIRTGERSS